MDTKTSLDLNIFCVAFALFALICSGDQTHAFILAYLVAAAGILFGAYRATAGDATQILAIPVTAVVLCTVFDNFRVQDSHLEENLCLLLLAVALGTSILASLNPGRGHILILVTGSIVGLVGVWLTQVAISHHAPGFGVFIPIDDIQKINPLHIDFFRPQYSDAELAERYLHNRGSEPGPLPWRYMLFALQTVVISAWDALVLSVGVWITSLAAIPLIIMFTRESAEHKTSV
jgi:hypothetical protein